MQVDENLIISLENNPENIYHTSIGILLELLNNIIKDPGNPKYRTIRLENKTIKEKLLPLSGIKEVLLKIGFEENDSVLILSPNSFLAKVKRYRDFIYLRYTRHDVAISSNTNLLIKKAATPITSSKSYLERIKFPKVIITDNLFLQSLEQYSDAVMQYEDQFLLNYGKSIIPIVKLEERAVNKLRKLQKNIKSNLYKNPEPCVKDLFLVELVNWFNTEFFEWVNTIPCKICKNKNERVSSTIENGLRVEINNCCGEKTKFFRYNDIVNLLKTRRGRCGEYANCFTFLCRCMSYDARLVYSTFDHVWTEVYSLSQKRWIHIDPSDNVVDAALMYQHGWKRTVDYVTAFSKNDVQDVTWRYTNNFKKTMSIRKLCTEHELVETICKLREKRTSNATEVTKRCLLKRTLAELAELMVERSPTENEKKGRSSGSFAWKIARGENNSLNAFVFELTEAEINAKQFNLRYSCSLDKYERYLIDNNTEKIINSITNWSNWIYSSKNLLRKVEHDWKMVYLAREEGTNNAEIIWKFDFSKSNMKIANYSLNFETKIYENGEIKIDLLNAEEKTNLYEANKFCITAKLSGGKGDIAWQHAQIFRQELYSKEFPFDLRINLH